MNTWLHSRFLPKNLPVVATIHHSVHDPALRPYKGFVRAAYHHGWIAPNERRVLRRASRIVAVSHFVAETARKSLLDVPMDVIYNGVDTEQFQPSARRRLPSEPFRLLYAGTWMARKGVDLLAPIMRALGDGFELRYTGGEAAAADKKNMPANMCDIGRLRGADAVIAALHDADALLFPSRSEGFGLVAAEAMACGLPVIATRGSSLVEVVEDGVTGVLCARDDVTSFAVASRRIRDDDLVYQAMVQAARDRAIKQFSEKKMLDAYLRVWVEATGT
ncbi:MAG: glycosyltransferase family 4 protein [Gammaproteobacteria bacterium]